MLKELLIENLILMQSCRISFSSGMTVLTGETGSGKTAVLQGLKLLLGQKSDPALIRKGEKKAKIEAVFEPIPQSVGPLLQELDIDPEEGRLILRRELSTEGKSKSFVNNLPVPSGFLQTIGALLLEVVDQSSHTELKSSEQQRNLLDRFGSCEGLVADFSALLERKKAGEARKKDLEILRQQKHRELDFCLTQQQELESISFTEEEENALFETYSRSCFDCEQWKKLEEIREILEEGTVFSVLRRCKNKLEHPTFDDARYSEIIELLDASLQNVSEALNGLVTVTSSLSIDPGFIRETEEKLSSIERIKKKYGSKEEERKQFLDNLRKKIEKFLRLEETKQALDEELSEIDRLLETQGAILTKHRTEAACRFSDALTKELKSLNMPHAEVRILVSRQERSKSGEDLVTFLIRPNLGEAFASVKDHASGGELSRLLLACKILSAEKSRVRSLIFDEIDANIGGTTASCVGSKLSELSLKLQVICITHFPQVAKKALHHLAVEKTDIEGRTISIVRSLDKKAGRAELARMLGAPTS